MIADEVARGWSGAPLRRCAASAVRLLTERRCAAPRFAPPPTTPALGTDGNRSPRRSRAGRFAPATVSRRCGHGASCHPVRHWATSTATLTAMDRLPAEALSGGWIGTALTDTVRRHPIPALALMLGGVLAYGWTERCPCADELKAPALVLLYVSGFLQLGVTLLVMQRQNFGLFVAYLLAALGIEWALVLRDWIALLIRVAAQLLRRDATRVLALRGAGPRVERLAESAHRRLSRVRALKRRSVGAEPSAPPRAPQAETRVRGRPETQPGPRRTRPAAPDADGGRSRGWRRGVPAAGRAGGRSRRARGAADSRRPRRRGRGT